MSFIQIHPYCHHPPPSQKVIRNEIEEVIHRFISGPCPKLSKQIIFSPTSIGGLGIPTLDIHWASLQCSWLKRIHCSNEIWGKILIPSDLDPVFFLAHKPPPKRTLSPGNLFWAQLLERWTKILSELPKNANLLHTNICNPTLPICAQIFKITPMSGLIQLLTTTIIYFPPPLRERFSQVNWKEVSIPLLSFDTAELRNKCRKAVNFCGNHAPFIHPILHHTNPNTQGCRQFSDLIQTRKFDWNQWKNFENLAVTHNIDHDSLQAQIIKLANTSKLIEGKDLQYLMLRNTCITNSKLYKMNIVTSPECTLCLHPTQDSAHRYFSCPFILPV